MVSSISTLAQNQFIRTRILELQGQMNTLQEQVSSGKKATVFSGISEVSSLSLQLNNIKKSTNEFLDNIAKARTRAQPMQGVLQRINDIAGEVRNDALIGTSDALDATKGNGALKALAQQRLNEIVSLLNIKVDTEYLFSGKASGTAPMQPFGEISTAGSILGRVAGLNTDYPLGGTANSGAQRYAAIKDYLSNSITRSAPGGSAPAPYGFQGETGAPGGNSFAFTTQTAAAANDTSIVLSQGVNLPIPGQYLEFGGSPPHNAAYLITSVDSTTRTVTFDRVPATTVGLDFAVAASTSVNITSPAIVTGLAASSPVVGADTTDAGAGGTALTGATSIQVTTVSAYSIGDRIEFGGAPGEFYDITSVDATTNTITFSRAGAVPPAGLLTPIGSGDTIAIHEGYAPGSTTITLTSAAGISPGMALKFSNSSTTYSVVAVDTTTNQIEITAESTANGSGLDIPLPAPVTPLTSNPPGGEITVQFGAKIEPLQVRIDNGIDLKYGIRADNPAIRKVLDALFALATTDLNTTTVTGYREIARLAADDLSVGRSMVTDLSAELGVKENVLDTTEQRHNDFLVVTETQIDRVENVDMADAVSRLTQTQTNLEASFKLLASIRNLSLANYI
jgi:flagellin-like hook-associated protein FlgL